jgi:hypothetical protein
MIALRIAALTLPLVLIGCSYDPAPPSPLPSSGSQVLRGIVYPGGTTTVWVQPQREGTLNVALTEESPAGVPLAVAFGGPTGAEGKCETDNPVNISSGSAPQPVVAETAGLFCIDVTDIGFVKSNSGVSFGLTVKLQ